MARSKDLPIVTTAPPRTALRPDGDRVTASAEGYTLVLCSAPTCDTAVEGPDRVAAAMSDCVRSSRHGVLVVSGCTLGPVACRLRPPGPLVLVQPCDVHRRPTGPVIRVGPLRTGADLDTVRNWIQAGRLDPALLPSHLITVHRTTCVAMTN